MFCPRRLSQKKRLGLFFLLKFVNNNKSLVYSFSLYICHFEAADISEITRPSQMDVYHRAISNIIGHKWPDGMI